MQGSLELWRQYHFLSEKLMKKTDLIESVTITISFVRDLKEQEEGCSFLINHIVWYDQEALYHYYYYYFSCPKISETIEVKQENKTLDFIK